MVAVAVAVVLHLLSAGGVECVVNAIQTGVALCALRPADPARDRVHLARRAGIAAGVFRPHVLPNAGQVGYAALVPYTRAVTRKYFICIDCREFQALVNKMMSRTTTLILCEGIVSWTCQDLTLRLPCTNPPGYIQWHCKQPMERERQYSLPHYSLPHPHYLAGFLCNATSWL